VHGFKELPGLCHYEELWEFHDADHQSGFNDLQEMRRSPASDHPLRYETNGDIGPDELPRRAVLGD
jgi:hypothetical protein